MKYDNIYLNANHLFSYYSGGYRIFIIVGARGRGKSFWAKRYCLKRLFRQKKKFTWIRPTESAVDTLKEFDGYKFYEDIVNANTFNERYSIKISGDGTINYKLFDDGEEDIPYEHAGYLMALSTFHKLKGNTFTEIKTIVFDEFIPEVGEVVRGDRARQFVNTVETICRLSKDTVIIMLANALDKGDRILNLFFQNIKEHGYYFNKEKLACMLYLPDSKEFNDRRFESISGKIIKNTPYEDTIASNKFLSMDDLYYDKKPPNLPLFCVLDMPTYRVALYVGDVIYVENRQTLNSSKVFCRNINEMTDKSRLIPKHILERLIVLYDRKRIKFDSEYTRQIFVEFIGSKH